MNTDKDDVKWEWEELEEVDSTNRVAMERVLERWRAGRRAAGVVVTAGRQTSGRGQHGRRWESPAGGLYMSAVLEDVPMEVRPRLALAVGVCVVEALESLGARGLKIRWPNDVVVEEAGSLKKLAGILCEAVAEGEKWAVVVGIGVNVNGADLPPGLAATSLAARGVRVTARAISGEIVSRLGGLRAVKLTEIVASVRQRDALRGQRVRLNDGAQIWDGNATGIDDMGGLVLDCGSAGMRNFERGSLHDEAWMGQQACPDLRLILER